MQENSASEFLRLHFCPHCGYDLNGLPRIAKCPECGFHYDDRMFTLVGRATKTSHFQSAWWVMMAYIAMLAYATRTYAIPLIAIAVLFLIAILLPMIRRRLRPEDWLLFTAEGVSSRHKEGEFSIIPWRNFKRVTIHKSFLNPRGMRSGMQIWQLRLFREPLFHFINPNSKWAFGRYRRTWRDITFEFRATNQEARGVVEELRQRFAAGWSPN